MKKLTRILALLMATATMATAMVSCKKEEGEKAPTEFKENEQGVILATEENTTMLGRTYKEIFRKYDVETKETVKVSDVLFFNWAASGFQVTFEGTGLKAQIVTNNPLNAEGTNNPPMVYVAVDGKDAPEECKIIHLQGYADWYTLCEGLPEGTHTVKVIRRDANSVPDGSNLTGVSSYEVIDGDTMLTPPALRERKIEAWGDSITCGDGLYDLGSGKSCSDGWQTYAAYTARALDAELNVISISGNGLICSLFGSKLFELPPRFTRIDEYSSKGKGKTENWDFSKYQADVVLINLGTNDSAGVPGNFSFQEFEDEYVRWALEIKEAYPDCIIIGMLGMMNESAVEKLYPSIENAAKRVNDQLGSEVFIPMWMGGISDAKAYDNGHPGVESHKASSAVLVEKIKAAKGW